MRFHARKEKTMEKGRLKKEEEERKKRRKTFVESWNALNQPVAFQPITQGQERREKEEDL